MAMRFHRVINISFIYTVAILIRSSQSDFNCDDCGGVFTTRQTIITSPNYPQHYPARVCCTYTIRSPYQCPVEYHIQFLDFLLESSINCTNDFFTVGNDTILCGHVTGIRKYPSQDGILRLRFTSNGLLEEQGFRLLITRLSCDETMTSNNTHQNTTKIGVHVEEASNNTHQPVVTRPNLELLPPRLGGETDLSKQTNQGLVFQAEQYLPPNNNPPPTPTTTDNGGLCLPQINNFPNQPGAAPGSCCVGSFYKPRFYLTSPDFPNPINASPPRDCFYYMEKSGPNVCRVRVAFRFFALGGIDTISGQCLSDFIEIDDERICGCRTGLVVEREWGLGRKVIRLRSSGGLSDTPSIGFILDVTQVDCGVRYGRQAVGGDIGTGILIPHAVVETNTNSVTRTRIYRYGGGGGGDWGMERPGRYDDFNSNLFFSEPNRCAFGYAELLRISFDPLWITRPAC